MSTLVERLNQSIKAKKLSWSAASVMIGLSPQAPSKWKKGQIGKETLEKLAEVLDVDLVWLQTGKGVAKPNHIDIEKLRKQNDARPDLIPTSIEIDVYEDGDPVPDGYVAIDYYPEVRASAGNGYLNIEDHSPYKIYLPIIELNECGAIPEYSKIFRIDGESMIPDLMPGQSVSIDTSARHIRDGEIYAFIKNGELKIKYLFKWNEKGQGGFKAVSRNPDKVRFPDEYYSPEQIETEGIYILGQYWWKSETRKVWR